MKLYQLTASDRNIVGVEFDRGMINFTEAFQVYNFIKKKRMMVRIGSLQELISMDGFSDELILRVFDYLETHSLWEQFLIEENYIIEAPIKNPGKILCVGLNYISHAAEGGQSLPDEPIFFNKAGSIVIGMDDSIELPLGVGRVDHELELAVIISRKAKNVTVDDFEQYVAGYTIFNDITARDMQRGFKETGKPWFLSKSLDTFGPMGPCMVTSKELPFPFDLEMELRVNGEVRQKANTANMVFKIPHLISWVSQYLTLLPGDVISTGTTQGISPLNAGDQVEAEIERIGILKNSVINAKT